MQAPKPQPLRSAFAFVAGAAAVLLLVAVPLWLLGGSGDDSRFVADTTAEDAAERDDVFMVPGFVPDGFHFVRGLEVSATGEPIRDSSEAAGVVLQYLPEGQFSRRADEPWLVIQVTDHLAVLSAALEREDLRCFDDDATEVECYGGPAPSACVGDPALAENRMDPETCMDESEERPAHAFGAEEVQFQRTTVRQLPAHIVRVGGGEFDLSITTYEGGPVLSEVTGNQVDRETLIRVANELHHVRPSEFHDFIRTAEGRG